MPFALLGKSFIVINLVCDFFNNHIQTLCHKHFTCLNFSSFTSLFYLFFSTKSLFHPCHQSYAAVTLLWHTLVILAQAAVLWHQKPYNVMGFPCMDSDPAIPQRTSKQPENA